LPSELVRHALPQLIVVETSSVINALRHQRIDKRLGNNCGFWPRSLVTLVGASIC
jgi:hypothetical protein